MALNYSFPDLEPVCCSTPSSNFCFLTCIQIPQETGQMIWYSHLFKNFPQFDVIHTVKGFGLDNKAKVDVFLKLSCFVDDPTDVGNFISGLSAGKYCQWPSSLSLYFSFLHFKNLNFSLGQRGQQKEAYALSSVDVC